MILHIKEQSKCLSQQEIERRAKRNQKGDLFGMTFFVNACKKRKQRTLVRSVKLCICNLKKNIPLISYSSNFSVTLTLNLYH